MNGRVKTIHPKIYAGILKNSNNDDVFFSHEKIVVFDMIVVNFYPFEQMLISKQHTLKQMLTFIDIGGPSLIRAAVKNFYNVIIITNPKYYEKIINYLNNNILFTQTEKLKFAIKALCYIKQYDSIILKYLDENHSKCYAIEEKFPDIFKINYFKQQKLVYGENKHQKSYFYIKKPLVQGSISSFKQTQGKSLSFNNILDADTALECVKEFDKPTCVIVKHGNPCGVSTKKTILEAYQSAYDTDPISAFGGVIAFNCALDEVTARRIVENHFVEVIITPPYFVTTDQIIKKKNNIRILVIENLATNRNELHFKHINGGLLLQEPDINVINCEDWKIVSEKKPQKLEIEDAVFCWKVTKFVKSNAMVYAKNSTTLSIGGGQTSRIDSTIIANIKANRYKKNVKGSVLASDAFLPFVDNVHEAAKLGISCIVQPGGSIRDKEIIDCANQYNIAMIFTHLRHFRH